VFWFTIFDVSYSSIHTLIHKTISSIYHVYIRFLFPDCILFLFIGQIREFNHDVNCRTSSCCGSSTNKTDPHDIKKILLKVTLNTITLIHITNEVCIFTNVLLHVYHRAGFELPSFVMIGTDCICSCTSNYHTITTTTDHIKRITSVIV
jgi:hypothetical protein